MIHFKIIELVFATLLLSTKLSIEAEADQVFKFLSHHEISNFVLFQCVLFQALIIPFLFSFILPNLLTCLIAFKLKNLNYYLKISITNYPINYHRQTHPINFTFDFFSVF